MLLESKNTVYCRKTNDNKTAFIINGTGSNPPSYIIQSVENCPLADAQHYNFIVTKPISFKKWFQTFYSYDRDKNGKPITNQDRQFAISLRTVISYPSNMSADNKDYQLFQKEFIPFVLKNPDIFKIQRVAKQDLFKVLATKMGQDKAEFFYKIVGIEKGTLQIKGDWKIHELEISYEDKVSDKTRKDLEDIFEDAYVLLKKHKVHKVMSGNCFVTKALPAKIWGLYRVLTDTLDVSANVKNSEDSLHTIIHELGHRYWYKIMDASKRKLVIDLYTSNILKREPEKVSKDLDKYIKIFNKAKQEESLIYYYGSKRKWKANNPWQVSSVSDNHLVIFPIQTERRVRTLKSLAGAPMDFVTGDWSVDGKLIGKDKSESGTKSKEFSDSVFPSDYSRKNIEEFFAEIFAYYIQGFYKNKEMLEFMKKVLN